MHLAQNLTESLALHTHSFRSQMNEPPTGQLTRAPQSLPSLAIIS